MQAHGEYRIVLVGSILHLYLAGDFNMEGSQIVDEAILDAAPKNTPWALCEHQKDNSGLTPDAIEEIYLFYLKLKKLNCVAIGLELSNVWGEILRKAFSGKLDIPIYFNQNTSKLETLLKQHLPP